MALDVSDVIEIHDTLVDWFAASEDPISPAGIKDQSLLESAVGRPAQTVGGVDGYKTIFQKAAALFHSLVNNHAFYNGNKRVALVSAQALLAQESYWLDYPSDQELFEFTRQAAAHELTVKRTEELNFIAVWLESNSRKARKDDHPLKYSDLKQILRRFGFEIDPPDGEVLSIYKGGDVVARVLKQGVKGFRPYHTDYISGLRKRLNLNPEHGVDSVQFYGHKGTSDTASQLIELRIEVMRKLAKT